MKRFLSILCALALLCSCSAAFAQGSGQPACAADAVLRSRTVTAAEERLMREWEKGLAAAHEIYSRLFWTLDYIDQWTQSTSWEALAQAKTACILLTGYANGYTHPEMSLTAEEIAQLAESGYAVEILADFALPAVTLDDTLLTVRYQIFPMLEEEAFWAVSLETVKEFSSATRQFLQVECEFFQLATNALWLPLQAQEDAGVLWRTLQDAYPVLFSEESVWLHDMEALEEANIALLSKTGAVEAQLTAQLNAIARGENILIDLENGRAPETISISGAPAGIPMPLWYDSLAAGYASFRVCEDGSVAYPVCGDALTKEDCSMLVQQSNVTLEQVEEYAQRLNPQRVSREENTWIVLTEDGKGVQMSWADGTVQFLFLRDTSFFMLP